ncbi:MAG: hypothetical protein BJ554DRAFT_3044, partial [Olpidium bornovanus]
SLGYLDKRGRWRRFFFLKNKNAFPAKAETALLAAEIPETKRDTPVTDRSQEEKRSFYCWKKKRLHFETNTKYWGAQFDLTKWGSRPPLAIISHSRIPPPTHASV